jgi:hypothetical protein
LILKLESGQQHLHEQLHAMLVTHALKTIIQQVVGSWRKLQRNGGLNSNNSLFLFFTFNGRNFFEGFCDGIGTQFPKKFFKE